MCVSPSISASPHRGKHGGKHIMTGTVHRVAIYDSMFRLMHIISQTDIIK
jgi:hypothetical protein